MAAVRERAAEAERRTAARLRAIDDFLARAEDILAEEQQRSSPRPPNSATRGRRPSS
ncbi:hypothetical protein [Amycolatopsis sp. NBC_01286]|uniref:hypothetical protein n=1 Tax=Amycolatopsis sp. NBC_01286 TaxID=2903560 RepID=UPI002E161ABF|nr:hypothetical protein OG570_40425 [Amycolatopsis sp. NBC_01286]